MAELISEKRIWFGEHGNNVPRLKRFLSDVSDTIPATTWWDYQSFGHNDEAKREAKALVDDDDVFGTPKPERLISKVLELATSSGDLVLDSFAGSGTTGAVAHKMGRRWIMVELGEHCHTHIIPRLKKVIDGEDKGGVTEPTNWQGGGGFRYYKLAPSLIVSDRWGNPVINPEYNAAMLAEALAKLEGFTYAPSEVHWWRHGHSSERDFIYVTTQTLNADQLQALSDDVGEGRSLLVCCAAYRGDVDRFRNLTLKKIPKMVLTKCEWGHDDYSLNVQNLPMAVPRPAEPSSSASSGRAAKATNPAQGGLFGGEDAST
jgi:adenine-specific DNA-methyltransferase